MADLDFSAMSDAELQAFIAKSRAELEPKKEETAPDFSKMSDEELKGFMRNARRQALREEGAAAVKKSMAAEPEYIEVPSYDAMGIPTGYTERVIKGNKADPIGRGAMSVLPFGEDLGAWARSTGGLGVPPSGRTFSEEKEMMQGEKEAAKAAYPTPFTVGQAAGIVPQMYLPFGLAARGTTALGRTALGAAEGAGYGALTGLGEGITPEERLQSAKMGALTGGVLGGALGRYATPAERAVEPAIPEAVVAAERLGVELPRYAITETPAVQRATKIAENLPFAGESVMAAREKAVSGLEEAVNNLLPKMTTEESGRKISEGIKGWMQGKFKKTAEEMYDEVRSLFQNPEATKTLDNTADVVSDIMARRAKAKLPGTPSAVDTVLPAIQSAEGLSYDGAKYLYSQVRNLRNENRIKGIDDADVERLYQALKKDVLDIAETAGGEPARFFLEKADRQYAMMQNTREKLQKIIGKKEGSVSDEQAFNRLFNAARSGGSADNNLVARAINAMDPQSLQAFQAGILAKLGRDASGKFSPDRWLGSSGINSLSPRAKSMIFKDQPQLLSALNDVTTVAGRFKNLNKFGNPSGTGQNVLGGMSIAGLIAEPVSTISALVGANAFTRIMSKPQSAKAMADWARRYENFVRRPSEVTGRAAYQAGQALNHYLVSESDKSVDLNSYLNQQ